MERREREHTHEQHIRHMEGHSGPPRHKGPVSAFLRRGFWMVFFIALVAGAICVPASLIATRLLGRLGITGGWALFLGGCAAVVLFILVIYIPFSLLRLYMGRHPKKPRPMPLYDDILEAIERLSTGDFDVLLEIDDRYRQFSMGEIAGRLNKLAQQLSGMETMRADFVANVSHEIQSPLTSIRGFAALLQKPGLDEETRVHYLQVIETECARLSKLSDNLLRLTMLEGDAARMDKQAYRLDKQLADILLVLEPQWNQKQLEVELAAPAVEICADKALLEQVWLNLVHNAVKFTPQGGRIDVLLEAEPGYVVCRVRDTGPGIAAEDAPHVFERFYKGDKSRQSGGNGLGLSLVKRIAVLHGGSVRLHRPAGGVGTEFVVELPDGH